MVAGQTRWPLRNHRPRRMALPAAILAAGLIVTGALARRAAQHSTRHNAHMALPVAPSAAGFSVDSLVTEAERTVTTSPRDAEAYRSLAIAFMRKQRQCGDPAYCRRAMAAVQRSLELEPNSYESRKLKAWVLAGQHRFAEARDLARECIARRPRDPWNYGTLADSEAELGDYPAAVAAAQQMIDLKPGLASYARAGHLRLLHGDAAGALPLFDLALDATDPRDAEAIAWVRVQRGDACVAMGRYLAADSEYQRALQAQPGYHLALAGRGRCQALLGHRKGAIRLYEQALAVIPRPDWAIAMGDLKQAVGDSSGAQAAFGLARVAMATAGPSADIDRQLALFLADHGDPAAAVEHARRAARERDDVYTDDALAWSLYQDHQYAEAWKVCRRARRLGTQDVTLAQHAARIAAQARGPAHEADRRIRKARVLG